MSNKLTICSAPPIEALLADRLNDVERDAFEQHLDTCATCRERLEQSAAEPELWSAARSYLSSVDGVPETGEFAGDSSLPHLHDETDLPRIDDVLAFLSPTDDPHMLGRFGGYEVAGVIGRGGMGVVLKGLDVPLNRYVAIKILAPHLATSAAARVRFAREARAAAAVVHENVIAIHAVSEANGLPFLVMPYVRGQSLQKRLDAQGPLSTPEILRIARQTAAGLAAAHAQGLVHRDIKPANILLEDGVERLRLTDFGLARAADDASLTRSGVIAGTPQFMSPEQARGESIDQRSDLFSLGSVLYMLCTGRVPFRAETSFGVLRRISDDVPRPIGELNPEIPEWLVTIVERLHAKNPAERFASANEVAQLCEQCLAHIQQPSAIPLPELLGRRPPKLAVSPRRRRTAIAAVLLCALAAVLLVVFWPSQPASEVSDDLGEQASPPVADLNEPAAKGEQQAARFRWDDGVDQHLSQLNADFLRAEQQIAPRSDDLHDSSLDHFSADPLRSSEWESTP